MTKSTPLSPFLFFGKQQIKTIKSIKNNIILDKINEDNQTAGPSKRGPSIFNSQSGPSRWPNGQKTNGSPAQQNSASNGQNSQNITSGSGVRKIGEVKLAPWEQNLHPQSCTCQECVVCPSCSDKFETKRGLIIHFSRLHRDQIKEPPTHPPTLQQNNQMQMVKVKVRKVRSSWGIFHKFIIQQINPLRMTFKVGTICVGFDFRDIQFNPQSSKFENQALVRSEN